jgi:hypothetical protein
VDENNKQEPDLCCFNLAVILDTIFTCPYPPSGSQLTMLEATKPLRAADNKVN